MKKFDNFPNDIIFNITQFLNAKNLFSFAKTSHRHKDIAHLKILSESRTIDEYTKNCIPLLNYWFENPKALLSKPNDLLKQIKEILIQRCAILSAGKPLILTYACLVILHANNLSDAKEYFYRLCVTSGSGEAILTPMLNKIAHYLDLNSSYQNFLDRLSKNVEKNSWQIFVDACMPRSADSVKKLISKLENNIHYKELLYLKSVSHIITSADGLKLAMMLSTAVLEKELFTQEHEMLHGIKLCLGKLNYQTTNLFLNNIFKQIDHSMTPNHSILGYSIFGQCLKILSIVVQNNLNSHQIFLCFIRLLDYLPDIVEKSNCFDQYMYLVKALIMKIKGNKIDICLLELDKAMAKSLNKDEVRLSDYNQKIEVFFALENDFQLFHEHDLLLSSFLKLCLKLPNKNCRPILEGLYQKLAKPLRACSDDLLIKYLNILRQTLKQSTESFVLYNYENIIVCLLLSLSAENQLKNMPNFDPDRFSKQSFFDTLTRLEKLSKEPAFTLSEDQADVYFRDNYKQYLDKPEDNYVLMTFIAKRMSSEQAKYYLQTLFDEKLGSWLLSDFYIVPFIEALAKRCHQNSVADVVKHFYLKFLNSDNDNYKRRCCNILKTLFPMLSLNEIKKFHSSLLEEFKKNYYPMSLIIESIAHTFEQQQVKSCIETILIEKCPDHTLVQKFLDCFSDEQITQFLNHYLNRLQDILQKKSPTNPDRSINFINLLIPRLNSDQLLMLFELAKVLETERLYRRLPSSGVQHFEFHKINSEHLYTFYRKHCDQSNYAQFIDAFFNFIASNKPLAKTTAYEMEESSFKRK